jgi:GMP synthase (glutamine-hydrolysing)
MAKALGGTVERTELAEFGRTDVAVRVTASLFKGQPGTQRAWMSHRDSVVGLPDGFDTAATAGARVAAFENPKRSLCGVQWHPEVMHSAFGQKVLERFLYNDAGIEPTLTTGSIIEESLKSIADTVGKRHVICGLSGGVDSAVAVALVQRTVGDQLTCVLMDHGLLRQGERVGAAPEIVSNTERT